MSDFEPGAVAKVTFNNASGDELSRGLRRRVSRVGVRYDSGWTFGAHTRLTDERIADPSLDVEIRPLVVLDLPAGALAGWPVLVDTLRKAREATGYTLTFNGLIDQIEAQTKPPKPAEPTAIGSRVEDRSGIRYTRFSDSESDNAGDWINEDGMVFHWGDIDVARVLSEGVQP